ncbi:MAG: hypothetical protein ABI425_04220 [Patescibacteria group bacterium]
MKERPSPYSPEGDESKERQRIIETAGNLLAEHLLSQPNPKLLLDMDGVIFRADSLHVPELTTPEILVTLRLLEAQGVSIGPATGRGIHVVNYLREQELKLSGPAILEEGQTIIQNGQIEYLGHPNHRAYMDAIKATLQSHPEFLPEWHLVQSAAKVGQFTFAPGNFQWQGECRSSFWFHYDGDPSQDRKIVMGKFEPIFHQLAIEFGLNYDRDVAVNTFRMQPNEENGNLAIIGIKGKLDGNLIDKGIAAQHIEGTWAFAADGFGDAPLSRVTSIRNGVVIGIEGNLDTTSDATEFLLTANVVLRNPREFNDALRHASHVIGQSE